MTLETAAVEFLRASVAKAKAKQAMRGLPCEHEDPEEYDDRGRFINRYVSPCRVEISPEPNEHWCDNCLKREPLMAERREALKTYNQARRRALRALKRKG